MHIFYDYWIIKWTSSYISCPLDRQHPFYIDDNVRCSKDAIFVRYDIEFHLSIEQDVSCFRRYYNPHHTWLQSYCCSYTQFHLSWKHGVDADAISKLYISKSIKVRIMIFLEINDRDVYHFQWASQHCILNMFLTYHCFCTQMQMID